jgi:hypothetical protein
MSREIRSVPANWEHPRDAAGRYIPLLDLFTEHLAEWEKGKNEWLEGLRPSYCEDVYPSTLEAYVEYHGPAPVPDDYVDYKGQPLTHFALYESTSEGTPVTPVFSTLMELENYLVEVGTFYHEKYSRKAASELCKNKWAPTFVGIAKEPDNPLLGLVNKLSEAKLKEDQTRKKRRPF